MSEVYRIQTYVEEDSPSTALGVQERELGDRDTPQPMVCDAEPKTDYLPVSINGVTYHIPLCK